MREFTKSMFSYSLALSFFGMKQMANILTPRERDQHRGPATKAFDSVTHCTTDQFGSTLQSTFSAINNLQRGVVDLLFGMLSPLTPPGGSRHKERSVKADHRDYSAEEGVNYADMESSGDLSSPVRPRRVF